MASNGFAWLSGGFFSLSNPIEPKAKPPFLLILKELLGSFCKKTFFSRSSSPLSRANASRPDFLSRKFREQQHYSENSEYSEYPEYPENSEKLATAR